MPEWPYITEAQDLPDFNPNRYAEPVRIVSGDTVTWFRSIGLYQASQGWSLHYSVRPLPGMTGSSLDVISVPAVPGGGNDHMVQLTPAQTSPLTAGKYSLQGFAVFAGPGPGQPAEGLYPAPVAGDRHQVYDGLLQVVQDDSQVPPGEDLRSHARRVLDNIEAVLEGRATKDVMDSEIAGVKMSRTPIRDLLLLRDRYLGEVRSEEREALARNGKATGRNILARFLPVGR